MANSEPGSRSNAVDHDFLAAFLGGEILQRHPGAILDEEAFLGYDAKKKKEDTVKSGTTDDSLTCTNCCQQGESQLEPCVTNQPNCQTKIGCETHVADCKTHPPHCKTHEYGCHHHKKAYEPPRHESWFFRP